MEPIVEAVGLTKHFGDVHALEGFDLSVERGKVLALLGPNGAGKTTFIRAVATLLRPTSGVLRVAGLDVEHHHAEVRRLIGLAGQYAAVEPVMSGRENLVMVARLFGHGRKEAARAADVVLEQLDLTDAGDRLVRTYSGGMRRRLDLGASLVGAPHLLLLDEPTTGLDPRSRNDLWGAIENLVAAGTDVLLTTQYLDEADRLADSIAIIDRGRRVAWGTSEELKARVGSDVIDVRVDRADLDRAQAALGEDATVDPSTGRVARPVVSGPDDLVEAVQSLRAAGVGIDDIALRRPTLDDVFLTLTGHTASEEEPVDEDELSTEDREVMP
jgi:daunorubicin resistance ABC transporter ATP-binding subunit